MVSNINEKTLSRKFHMNVRSFPGANTRDLQDYVFHPVDVTTINRALVTMKKSLGFGFDGIASNF